MSGSHLVHLLGVSTLTYLWLFYNSLNSNNQWLRKYPWTTGVQSDRECDNYDPVLHLFSKSISAQGMGEYLSQLEHLTGPPTPK